MEENKVKAPAEKKEESKTQAPAKKEVKTEATSAAKETRTPKAKTSDLVRKAGQDRKPFQKKPGAKAQGGNRGPRRGKRPQRGFRRDSEFEERVVDIARVTNVVKGGRRFSFSALVVIGDKKGRVAYGHGKAKEVPEAIKKAIKDARRKLIRVPIIKGGTIPHETQAKFISSNIMLKPAKKGKGIIASGAVRAVVELAGYHDIVTKSLGSSNKANSVKATIKALSQLKTVAQIAKLRDKDISHFQ